MHFWWCVVLGNSPNRKLCTLNINVLFRSCECGRERFVGILQYVSVSSESFLSVFLSDSEGHPGLHVLQLGVQAPESFQGCSAGEALGSEVLPRHNVLHCLHCFSQGVDYRASVRYQEVPRQSQGCWRSLLQFDSGFASHALRNLSEA